MFAQKLTFTFIFFIINFLLLAQETNEKRTLVAIVDFSALEETDNPNYRQLIKEKLKKRLQEKNYEIIELSEKNLQQNLQKSRTLKAHVLVTGFYKKKDNQSNLIIYGQVYDPETGFVIDAYNSIDYLEQLKELNLDKGELLEADEERVEKFTKKFISKIQANPDKKTNSNEIETYITSFGLDKKQNLPIKIASKEDDTSAVFDLLQNQITVSATKVSKRANEAPNLVSILSQKEIHEYGRISINDILYQLPGFAPSRDFDRRTVTSRGMFEGWNNNHLLMLIDGIQFNDSLYGTAFTWELTPLNIIKNIEVIRGPGSALYGSNATNGVVSLNTYSGEDLKGEARVRLRAGDKVTRIYEILTGNKGNLFSHVVSYTGFGTNGNSYKSYDGSYRTDLFGFYQKFLVRDERNNNYIFLKLEGEEKIKGLSLQYHRQQWSFETGHGWLWRIPDLKETLNESMESLVLKYNNKITDSLIQEYAIRYQERKIDWNLRFAEVGAYEGYYPTGVSEILTTQAKELLGRAQWTYLFKNGGSALLGLEGSGFRYNGDKNHLSNIDLKDVANGFPPYEDGIPRKQGPWLEWIKDRTIPKGAIFGQIVSGKFLYDKLELTLGVRYDEKVMKFKQIDNPYSGILEFPYQPEAKRVFRKTSPRVGLVVFLTNSLNLKLMAGRAFREPSITEMFGANTFTLASNPRQLKPEIINTRELALDWFITRNLNWRINFFQTNFENQIAYSVANNNLSTNIYTLKTRGLETELLYEVQNLGLFMNCSYNQRIDEKVQDKTVSEHKKSVTWAPSNTQNFGVRGKYQFLLTSISIQRQGIVYRRNSDFGVPEPLTGYVYIDPYQYPVYRPRNLSAWINLNFRLTYLWKENIEFGLFVSNALNSHQELIKNNNYPFDYIRENRIYMVDCFVRL